MAPDDPQNGNSEPQPANVARSELNPVNAPGYVKARILYPALGFPEVIGPASEGTSKNGTSSIHLLLVCDQKSLLPRHVARHLRYVPWDDRHKRYLKPNTQKCSFPLSAIEVKEVQVQKAGDLAEEIRFARGYVSACLPDRYLRVGQPEARSRALQPLLDQRVREGYPGTDLRRDEAAHRAFRQGPEARRLVVAR
jgi:hypothetical protein